MRANSPSWAGTCHYQPQPATYNQHQQYIHYIITQQDPSRTVCDRDKVGKCGNIRSGIPSPDIKKLPIIPLGNDS